MRSLAQDSAYLAGIIERIPGPVVLAGHSWAGAAPVAQPAAVTNLTLEALRTVSPSTDAVTR